MPDAVTLVRSDEPFTAVVDGEVVMFSPAQGAYFGLDPVGTRVWELLEEPRTIDDVCTILTEEFAVDAKTCHDDVVALVEQLRDAELVSEVP
jgi:hypothetical protein